MPVVSGVFRETVAPVVRSEYAKGSTDQRMALPMSSQQEMVSAQSSRRVASGIVASAAALGTAIVLGAGLLWFHYGTAVFFEMIASGFASCF